MNNLNLNSTKFYCRTCLEQKNDLLSLYSVDVNSGVQICDMILQTSQVQVNEQTLKKSKPSDLEFFIFRFITKSMRLHQFAASVVTS